MRDCSRKKARAVGAGFACLVSPRLVANGNTGNVGTAKRPADGFSLIALEAGEAGAVELAVILGDYGFGEGVGPGQEAAGAAAGGFNALLRFVLTFQGTDLHDPAGMDGHRLG